MNNCKRSILSECGVWPSRATPTTSTFDICDAPKATCDEVKLFCTFDAELAHLAKRVRPECLVAAAFPARRNRDVDGGDTGKLTRLLCYLRATENRGIMLRVGDNMTVSAFIDASYGVHQYSGKSQTGCIVVLGEAGVLSARSSNQKIVNKSSTEIKSVAFSSSAARAMRLKNFVE